MAEPEYEQAYLRQHASAIAEAAVRIRPHVRQTPALTTELSPHVLLKLESFQVTGSFKARGAFNAILRLKESRPNVAGVLAVSSGNHAQAVALASREAGLEALILIPAGSNRAKIAATRGYGAEVITDGVTFGNRDELSRRLAAERGLEVIHPYDNWDVIHGQGTAAHELLEDHPDLTTLVTPVGGGGLLSGTALVAKAHNPDLRVVGVEPESACDAALTFRTGIIQRLPEDPITIADGVRTRSIGTRNFEVMVERKLIDDIVTVTEQEIEEGLLTAWTRLRLAIEPTGALPLAALLAGKLAAVSDPPRRQTGLIVSGGNFDPAQVATLLSR